MNNIEEIIKNVKKNDIDIPAKVQKVIDTPLKNKNKKRNYYIKLVPAILSVFGIMLGGFGVYAVSGGTINGIPALDWIGVKFSDKYVEYKQPVEKQIFAFEETVVELTSTLCSEGITILEFNVKLSEEDYKKLKIDESIVTESDLEQFEKSKEEEKERIIINLKKEYMDKELQKGNLISVQDLVIPEEEINTRYEESIKEMEERFERRKNTKYIPALALNCGQIGGTVNYDVFNPNMEWEASIYIDDIPVYVGNYEKIEKINDYEYKIYVLYAINDDILDGKNEFKISLKNNKLMGVANWENRNQENNCERLARRVAENDMINLPNDIEVQVSKKELLENSKILDNLNIQSKFRNITQTVEKVIISPLQTIVKINHSATDQSSNAFANRYEGKPEIEHLPSTRAYKIFDANGKELSYIDTSNKNTLIYSDGTREDYDRHDVPTKEYSNAVWENIEYLLIENTDTDYIKIVPVEVIRNPIDEKDDSNEEIYYEMDALIINLK